MENSNNSNLLTYIFNLNLANGEILGSVLLVYGYIQFINSALLDKKEIFSEINDTKIDFGASEAIYNAEKTVFFGLVILASVAIKRFKKGSDSKEKTKLYKTIAFSYILSVYANMIRLEAFNQLTELND